MGTSKILIDGVGIDLTADTVTAGNMLSGVTAHDASGDTVTGTIAYKTSHDMTDSGPFVTAPAGYYPEASTKSVEIIVMPSGPSISVDNSTGVITATYEHEGGYMYAGTETKTRSLNTQAATTITPSTSSQTAVAAGRYTTGAVTVAAIQTETKTATSNGTVTPTSGKYLSSVTVAIPVYDGTVE